MLERVEVTTVGAWCAISRVPVLIGGGALLSSSGAGDLIPHTGTAGQEWLLAVASASGAFAAGGWLLILMGYLVLVAFVGLYFTLREAGSIMVLATLNVMVFESEDAARSALEPVRTAPRPPSMQVESADVYDVLAHF